MVKHDLKVHIEAKIRARIATLGNCAEYVRRISPSISARIRALGWCSYILVVSHHTALDKLKVSATWDMSNKVYPGKGGWLVNHTAQKILRDDPGGCHLPDCRVFSLGSLLLNGWKSSPARILKPARGSASYQHTILCCTTVLLIRCWALFGSLLCYT